MRSFRHWSPRYIKNRFLLICDHFKNPTDPWLTRSAIEILKTYFKKTDKGLEFGSGRSTLWFAKRIKHLTSVENDEKWFKKTKTAIQIENLKNIKYVFFPADEQKGRGERNEYVTLIDGLPNNHFDFVLIDGIFRDLCAIKILSKIRPGGILIIDNVNWYLPFETCSPSSRSYEDGPDGLIWNRVFKIISSWRKIWTSNGVWDTAIYFKPRIKVKS